MPNFDGTCPRGMGPGTRYGFGPCGLGLGWRRRFGAGSEMGRYFGWNEPQSKEKKIKALADYKKALEEELEYVKKESGELEKQV